MAKKNGAQNNEELSIAHNNQGLTKI